MTRMSCRVVSENRDELRLVRNIGVSDEDIFQFLLDQDLNVAISRESIKFGGDEGRTVFQMSESPHLLELDSEGFIHIGGSRSVLLNATHLIPVVQQKVLKFLTLEGKERIVVELPIHSMHVNKDYVALAGSQVNAIMHLSGQ